MRGRSCVGWDARVLVLGLGEVTHWVWACDGSKVQLKTCCTVCDERVVLHGRDMLSSAASYNLLHNYGAMHLAFYIDALLLLGSVQAAVHWRCMSRTIMLLVQKNRAYPAHILHSLIALLVDVACSLVHLLHAVGLRATWQVHLPTCAGPGTCCDWRLLQPLLVPEAFLPVCVL
jgi:hypothetical protein